MDNYIVDPMFFYWCKVINGAFMLCMFAFIIMCASLIVFVLISALENVEYDSVFEIPKFKKRFAILLTIAILLGLAVIFVPGQETLIEMEIARHATYDNLEIVIQKIIDSASKILDSK